MAVVAPGGIPAPSFERPRTLVHPGPRADVRLAHVAAQGARQIRLSLPQGTCLHEGLTQALAAAGEVVTDYESEWLEKMVAADGEVDELESRLIARLAAEA